MSVDLTELENIFFSNLENIESIEKLEELEAEYLGKKGKLKEIL